MKYFCLLFLLYFFPLGLVAQRVAYGRLLAEKDGRPAAGCTIQSSGSGQSTVSDSLGYFTIQLGLYDQILSIEDPEQRYISTIFDWGALYDSTVWTIRLSPFLEPINLIRPESERHNFNQVDVNYLTRPQDLDDPLSVLQGRTPGLLVARPGSDPNEKYALRFHGLAAQNGNNAPALWLHDTPLSDLSLVHPADLESLEVQPDLAHAAAIGLGSAAGVVVVKSPLFNHHSREWHVAYTTGLSLSTAARVPKTGTTAAFRERGLGNDFGKDTRWTEEVQRQPLSHTHHLSVNKRWIHTQLRTSLTYTDRQGILLNSQYQQYQGNAFLLHNFKRPDVYVFGHWMGARRVANYSFSEAFQYALNANPTLPVRDLTNANFEPFGGYGQTYFQFEEFNPVALLEQNRDLGQKDHQLLILGSGWSINRHWDLSVRLSGYDGLLERGAFYDRESLWNNTFQVPPTTGRIALIFEKENRYFGSAFLEYNSLSSGKWGLLWAKTGIIGQAWTFRGDESTAGRVNRRTADIHSVQDVLKANAIGFVQGLGRYDSLAFEQRLWGVLTELNWSDRERSRWQITAGLRNQNDVVGRNNRGSFPYAMGQYNLNNWLKIKRLDHLLAQISWGKAASHITYNRWTTRRELALNLHAETYDLGWAFDLQAYQNQTLGLDPKPVPLYPPRSQPLTQRHRNQGASAAMSTTQRRGFHWFWRSTLNVNWLRTRIYNTHLDTFAQIGDPFAETTYQRSYNGAQWGEIWGYYAVRQNADSLILQDFDGDGYIGSLDVKKLGNAAPQFWMGWQNVISWKNFTLSTSFRGVLGHQLIHENRFWYERTGSSGNHLETRFYPSAQYSNWRFYQRFVEKASFLRLDDLQLSWGNRFGQCQITCFVGGQNLLTLTRYTGNDPEIRILGDRSPNFSGNPPKYSTPTDPRAIGIDRRGTYWLEKAFYTGVRLRLY